MSLVEMLRLFRDWWLREFLELWPEKVRKWLSRSHKPVLLLSPNEETLTLELLNGEGTLIVSERRETKADVTEMIERLLMAHQVAPKETDIGLSLPEHCFFTRDLQLPYEAAREVEALSVQDLVRKTPFKTEDIYCDHVAAPIDGRRRIHVKQSIVRKRYVDDALLALDFGVENLAFITCRAGNTGRRGPTIALKKADARDSWLRKLTVALVCSALAFLIVGGSAKYWRQQREIDRLAIEVATVNKKARQVRLMVDQLQEKKGALVHLRLQRGERPGLIDLWEEMTRLLPTHTWLTEFRLSETASQRDMQVAISGFSGAAPSLVGIVGGSPMLSDAGLTSPVAFDAAEGRERFSLQAKVKMPEIVKEAAR